eukprot:XP_004919788.1 PREDICTED: putative nuclease HARBI1 isoform X2 [Xenopus tropicalis]
MNILSIVSAFPGSSHDAYILRQSGLYQAFETGQMPHGWLLGDAGYPCGQWLITRSRAESDFNQAHVRMRSVIERTFGVLKSPFRCLDRSGGSLLYSPTKVANIIAEVADDLEVHPLDPVQRADARGSQVRGQIVNNYFA